MLLSKIKGISKYQGLTDDAKKNEVTKVEDSGDLTNLNVRAVNWLSTKSHK
jgi:hypothetical protein